MSTLDITHLACPMTWVRTRVALGRLGPGESLEVLLVEGEPLTSVPKSAEAEGHRVLSRAPAPDRGATVWRVVLLRSNETKEESWPSP